MKKYIAIFILFIAFTATNWAANTTIENIQIMPKMMGKVNLAAGTLIYLETNERIFTDQATVGKIIQFKVKMNVTVNGKVVVKTGAAAIGRIKTVQAATFNNPAEITIELTSVQAVDGQQVPLNGTEQTIRGEYPNQGTQIPIGTSITTNVMNDIEIKV